VSGRQSIDGNDNKIRFFIKQVAPCRASLRLERHLFCFDRRRDTLEPPAYDTVEKTDPK